MGKARDLFKKARDTKGIFYAKMGTIKDRNDRDLTEAENIKRWQEYTELYRKDNQDGVITMNKVNGGWECQLIFQSLKHDAVKVLHSIYQQIWKTQ